MTVVVPVYNPGAALEPGVDSLLRQSLPRNDFDVIYVDDGSTDGSGDRLDELAAEHDNVSVHHIPNSGWPGRPRNVGIDHARGRYVQFMDQDDALGEQALERLYDMAERTDADVVIGKVASNFRPVLHEMFRADLQRQTIHTFPMMIRSLTPHKLFRLSLLREHQIRFPEGPRRLEDQPFVCAAYFAARSVAVLSSYVCYYYRKRDDGQNTASRIYSPRGYYDNLREVLDVVEKNTEPGQFRDLLLGRFYSAEMVGRLGGKGLSTEDLTEFRVEQFNEVRRLALERFGPGVAAGASAAMRVRSHLMLADDINGIEVFARHYDEIRAAVTLDGLSWADGRLQVSVSARMRDAQGSGEPLTFERDGDHWLLSPRQLGMDLPAEVRDATDGVATARAEVVIRNRETSAEYYLPTRWEKSLEPVDDTSVTPYIRGTATLDPQVALFGDPLTRGRWDLSVRVDMAGWTRTTRLGSTRAADLDASSRVIVVAPHGPSVLAYWTQDHDNLSVAVGTSTPQVAQRVKEDSEVRLVAAGRGWSMSVSPPIAGRGDEPLAGRLVLTRVGATPLMVTLPSTTRFVGGRTEISADLPRRHRVRTRGLSLGLWRVGAVIDDIETPKPVDLGVVLRVPGSGALELCPSDAGAMGGPAPLSRRLRRLISR